MLLVDLRGIPGCARQPHGQLLAEPKRPVVPPLRLGGHGRQTRPLRRLRLDQASHQLDAERRHLHSALVTHPLILSQITIAYAARSSGPVGCLVARCRRSVAGVRAPRVVIWATVTDPARLGLRSWWRLVATRLGHSLCVLRRRSSNGALRPRNIEPTRHAGRESACATRLR